MNNNDKWQYKKNTNNVENCLKQFDEQLARMDRIVICLPIKL